MFGPSDADGECLGGCPALVHRHPAIVHFFLLFFTRNLNSLVLLLLFSVAFLSSNIPSKLLTNMSTPPFQPYTSRGRATSQRQSTQGPRGIDRENLRTPQRIPSAPPRLRPIREAKNEPPIRPLPSASSMPVIEASPPPRRPRTPPPELDIPHEGLMLIELKTNVKVRLVLLS